MSDEETTPPNLDLIRMVQAARMQQDSEALPSQVSGVYWIEAKRKTGDYPAPTRRSGHWVIGTTVQNVDALWLKIREATEAGKLGYKSKVSTAAGPGQHEADARLICARTYDSADQADVQRVRDALRELGVDGDLRYERDRPQKE
jgi:hypothetical protein